MFNIKITYFWFSNKKNCEKKQTEKDKQTKKKVQM